MPISIRDLRKKTASKNDLKKMSDWNYSVPTVVTTSLSKQFKQWQVGSGTKMALPRPGGAAAVPRRLPRRR
jgi:hypothetical protein